ncbi:MAG: hypothetical protein JW709_08585 [Sedimentisphaerales bacterium]|nr:hypothetical protein [Sedimentisphaerales bacterium]
MLTTILFNPEIEHYDFGPGHAFRGERFASFRRMYQETLAHNPHFQWASHDESATDEELGLWHTQDYINMLRAASLAEDDEDSSVPEFAALFGCGPKTGPSRQSLSVYVSRDNLNPLTGRLPEGIENAARAIVKNSMLAVDYVLQGKTDKAVGLGGGLHHAKANYGEGFCIYNDVVIAARYAMKAYGLERILILDTDAHAGNGTCEAFYNDPGILFIDVHQTGIYPGTGLIEETGAGKGKGFTVNIPLKSGSGDAEYERIFDEIIFPLAREFRPRLIIRNGGSDPHFADNLTGLGLTLAGFWMIGDKVRRLSDELCRGKCVDLICSGYNPDVLAGAWISLIAGLSGIKVELKEPVPRIAADEPAEIADIIYEVRKVIKPYWKCLG